MNKSNDAILLSLIKQVRYDILVNKVIEHEPEKKGGICQLVALEVARRGLKIDTLSLYKKLNQVFVGWPYHTGISAFPVPRSESMFYNLWEEEQLVYRIDLLCYSISKLEKKVWNEWNEI